MQDMDDDRKVINIFNRKPRVQGKAGEAKPPSTLQEKADLAEDVLLNPAASYARIFLQRVLEGMGTTVNPLYLRFSTTHPGVIMPDWLKSQYKEHMTIVFQHEWARLEVSNRHVGVSMTFKRVPAWICVPWDAVLEVLDERLKLSFSGKLLRGPIHHG